MRGNFWRYVDFDGDGKTDLVVGVDDWTEYGWDNAYTPEGKWIAGPLRGFVYVLRNSGTNDAPKYETAGETHGGRQAGGDVRLAVAVLRGFSRQRENSI